jgi:hypothetical protein
MVAGQTRSGNGSASTKNVVITVLTILSTIAVWEQMKSLAAGKTDYPSSVQAGEVTTEESLSFFDKTTKTVFESISYQKEGSTSSSSSIEKRTPPVKFRLSSWNSRTDGGLTDLDRMMLAKIYGQANSVFEYGLGESTYLANYLQVPRYAGIDSSIEWVDMVKKKVSNHFRFYFADVGETLAWGVPANPNLPKTVWQYQLAPLRSELKPFDVYMVDGRWRTPCVLASFLHASATGAAQSDTTVLLHDCVQPKYSSPNEIPELTRKNYTANDDILDLVDHSRSRLCVYKRKPTTTDAMLWERYMKYKNDSN